MQNSQEIPRIELAARVIRSASGIIIPIALLGGFEVVTPATASIAFIGGSCYVGISAAFWATLTKENQDKFIRKLFRAFDGFLHANSFVLDLDAGIAVVVIDAIRDNWNKAVIVPDWVFPIIDLPATVFAGAYAVTQYRGTQNKYFNGLLLASGLSLATNAPVQIAQAAGVSVHYLVRTGLILGSSVLATGAVLAENCHPLIPKVSYGVRVATWFTNYVTLGVDLSELNSILWNASYAMVGLAGVVSAAAVTKIIYDAVKKAHDPEQALLVQQEDVEKQEDHAQENPAENTQAQSESTSDKCRSCWSGFMRKISFWSEEPRVVSENNSSKEPVQNHSQVETDSNLKSHSLNQ
jgi:hypothetical protein